MFQTAASLVLKEHGINRPGNYTSKETDEVAHTQVRKLPFKDSECDISHVYSSVLPVELQITSYSC